VGVSIRTRIEDAMIQYAIGRPEGALLSVLTAVSATSRRRRPFGTRSQRKSGKKMLDGEAFELFLKDEMPRMCRALEFNVEFRGELRPLEQVFYKWLRCQLAHEAGLPTDVRFEPSPKPGAFRVLVDDSGLHLSHNWLDRLADAVIFAPENNDLFGLPPKPPGPIYLPKLDVTIGGPRPKPDPQSEGSTAV
jgi:hypothetical protein